ncbi:MAG TPA: mycothiol system anti-sigma-R factor [Candidatus Nitrosotalea sp.]|nr:mycothiol system anti-sigma-R factor [Candidatus Nitrosotalea sp.]
MNCPDCRERIDRFVDRELSEDDLRSLEHHLSACPDCDDEYRLQSNVKRLVRVACGEGEAPAQLRERLRQLLS